MTTKSNETPTAAEFGQLIAAMAKRGRTAQAARAVIGNAPQGRTRKDIADALIAWARQLPKG